MLPPVSASRIWYFICSAGQEKSRDDTPCCFVVGIPNYVLTADRHGRVRAKFQARSATKDGSRRSAGQIGQFCCCQRSVLEERSHEPGEKLYCGQSGKLPF